MAVWYGAWHAAVGLSKRRSLFLTNQKKNSVSVFAVIQCFHYVSFGCVSLLPSSISDALLEVVGAFKTRKNWNTRSLLFRKNWNVRSLLFSFFGAFKIKYGLSNLFHSWPRSHSLVALRGSEQLKGERSSALYCSWCSMLFKLYF